MTIGQTVDSIRKDGALGWYGQLSLMEKRTFWGCCGGWMLDAFDFQLYGFVIPTLIAVWQISNTEAGTLATVTLLASAFGGWLAGILADRFGRVRALQITIAWFAFFTFLQGFAQNFGQLMVCRALMGVGFGGEWAAGAVLMGEIIRAEHRGKAVGIVQSSWQIGWALAAIMYAIYFTVLPADVAWRALFLTGVVPALLVIYLRKYVEEPPVFKAALRVQSELHKRASAFDIFRIPLLKKTLLCCLLSAGVQGGFYAIAIWLPTFLRTQRKLTVLSTSGYLAVVICGALIGSLLGAYLADRIGRRKNFIVYAIGSALIVPIYTYVPFTDAWMLLVGFPLGFFSSGIYSGMGPFFTELFPTPVRASGCAFSYNFGRGLGALFPMLVGALTASLSLGNAIGLFAGIAYGLILIAVLLLPETKGRVLTATD
jgi:MFS family permease